MALTVAAVESHLIDQLRGHITNDGLDYSTEATGTNADLAPSILAGLHRHGLYPDELRAVTDEDLEEITPPEYPAFLLGCVIATKRRILNYYLSQVTRGMISNRVEFIARARAMAEDIERDERLYATLAFRNDGTFGGPLACGTNIPDAIGIAYRAS